jgi:hypothetical protein
MPNYESLTLPEPIVQARQIVGAWRTVGDGNDDALLIRCIHQAIQQNQTLPTSGEPLIRRKDAAAVAREWD